MTASPVRYRLGPAPLELAIERPALFADLHLQPERFEEISAFAGSLFELPPEFDSVVILGDLFEAYVGREAWTHPNFELLTLAFAGLRQRGLPLVLLRGNRDVLLTRGDGRALGIHVADSLVVRGQHAPSTLLTHGDEFCLSDRPYQRLRRILRMSGVRALLRALPWRLKQHLARRMRGYSMQEVARKPVETLGLTLEAVQQRLEQCSAQQAVVGHLHRAERHTLADGRGLEVLPAWQPGSPPLVLPKWLDETR